jgi:hypothetical protein
VPHHRQVVRDHHVGEPHLLLQILEEVDHLSLDRHVECGHRLVGDDQLGFQGERTCDADALPLTAGELVRVSVVVLRVESDQLEQILHRALGAVLGLDALDTERRAHDRPDRVPRVQRRERILEDHLHVAAQGA